MISQIYYGCMLSQLPFQSQFSNTQSAFSNNHNPFEYCIINIVIGIMTGKNQFNIEDLITQLLKLILKNHAY